MAVSRRSFIHGSMAIGGASALLRAPAARASASNAGLAAQDLPQVSELRHLMNRASFGLSEHMQGQLGNTTAAQWLAEQLRPQAIDDTAAEHMVERDFPGYTMSWEEQKVFYRRARITMNNQDTVLNVGLMSRDLRGATFTYQRYSKRQLLQVMVDFWNDHFNVFLFTNNRTMGYKLPDDRRVFRTHAMGRFGDLLEAVAQSPSMMAYLDVSTNRWQHPNENYARELLELHTLGEEHYYSGQGTAPAGHYTETDIQEIARCFTGWNYTDGAATFVPRWHDTGDKTVLGQTIAGRSGSDGMQEGLEVLRLLAELPQTARHVCLKLAQRFVSDQPDPALVASLASRFVASQGDIPSVLETLFSSAAFDRARDEKLLRPLEFMHKMLHAVQADVDHSLDTGRNLLVVTPGNPYLDFEAEYLSPDGQALFAWNTPDGYPLEADHWANPNGFLQRWRFATRLLENDRLTRFVSCNPQNLVAAASTPEEFVSQLSSRVLGRSLLDWDRDLLIDFASEGRSANAPIPEDRRRPIASGLLGLILNSAYFQLH